MAVFNKSELYFGEEEDNNELNNSTKIKVLEHIVIVSNYILQSLEKYLVKCIFVEEEEPSHCYDLMRYSVVSKAWDLTVLKIKENNNMIDNRTYIWQRISAGSVIVACKLVLGHDYIPFEYELELFKKAISCITGNIGTNINDLRKVESDLCIKFVFTELVNTRNPEFDSRLFSLSSISTVNLKERVKQFIIKRDTQLKRNHQSSG